MGKILDEPNVGIQTLRLMESIKHNKDTEMRMYTDYIMSKRTTLSNCKKCSNSNEKLQFI